MTGSDKVEPVLRPKPLKDSPRGHEMSNAVDSEQERELSRTIEQLSLQSGRGRRLFELPGYLQPYKQSACAYLASGVSMIVSYPLDSIKTRQQTYKYKNSIQCISETFKSEGLRGFYRGLLAPLVASSMGRSVSMTIYGKSLPSWSKIWFSLYNPAKPSDSALIQGLKNSPITLSAGATAGLGNTAFFAPFEFVKIAAQIEMLVQRKLDTSDNAGSKGKPAVKSAPVVESKPTGSIAVAKHLIEKGGLRVLYSGWKVQLPRDLIGSGIYFASYDNFKRQLSRIFGADGSPDPVSIAVAGALSGTCCWLVVFPLDTYKTHYQRDVVIRQFYKDRAEKLGQFKLPSFRSLLTLKMYRGLGVSVIRTSLVGVVFFTCYENFMGMC